MPMSWEKQGARRRSTTGAGLTVFTLESARAALALGPVRYECNVCGMAHTAGGTNVRSCIQAKLADVSFDLRATGAFSSLKAAYHRFHEAAVQLGMESNVAANTVDPISYNDPLRREAWALITDIVEQGALLLIAAGHVGVVSSLSVQSAIEAVELARAMSWFARRWPGENWSWMLMAPAEKANMEIARLVVESICDPVAWHADRLMSSAHGLAIAHGEPIGQELHDACDAFFVELSSMKANLPNLLRRLGVDCALSIRGVNNDDV